MLKEEKQENLMKRKTNNFLNIEIIKISTYNIQLEVLF